MRCTALVMLAWVAVDLADTGLCALDKRPLAVAASLAALDARANPPLAPVNLIDDCFCCSHCVDVSVSSALQPFYQLSVDLPHAVDVRPLSSITQSYRPPRS